MRSDLNHCTALPVVKVLLYLVISRFALNSALPFKQTQFQIDMILSYATKSGSSLNGTWKQNCMMLCILGDTGFFRLQGIKVLWRLQFLGYLRTLSLKFQKARTKIEVVLTLPFWPSQFSSKNFSLHNTLIPNLVKPLMYIQSIFLKCAFARFWTN